VWRDTVCVMSTSHLAHVLPACLLQTVLDARKRIWIVDNGGLVTRERGDTATLEPYKLPFTHSGARLGAGQCACAVGAGAECVRACACVRPPPTAARDWELDGVGAGAAYVFF